MSYYEAITILVSILSFGTTTFFAYLVYKLSKQSNELSQQANAIATELLAIQRQEIKMLKVKFLVQMKKILQHLIKVNKNYSKK